MTASEAASASLRSPATAMPSSFFPTRGLSFLSTRPVTATALSFNAWSRMAAPMRPPTPIIASLIIVRPSREVSTCRVLPPRPQQPVGPHRRLQLVLVGLLHGHQGQAHLLGTEVQPVQGRLERAGVRL